jgi:hypothetical protein
MRTLIDRINEFENGDETVKSFNEIFTTLPLKEFREDQIVTIGEPCSPETTRFVTVGNVTFRYDFKKNLEVNEGEVLSE